ncbi:MAG: serine kinase of the hpr protein regulates carbohydrate metabolism [Rhodospirillaceae bacterium]|nr:MAG: serine kinase of the hpr protein regulates carbohydrate metabolism [Rhodospirillaceae bacterium]
MNGRHRYLVYGLVIESELPLTSVHEAASGDGCADVTLLAGSPDYFRAIVPGGACDPEDWIEHVVLDDGSVYMKSSDVFEATISADGRTAVCRMQGDVEQRAFEANLLNFVVSASLTLQGEETLHATVLEMEGRAVGLLGQSGAGKSTLAAYLISRGADLITDDMLRMSFAGDTILAYPGPYRLKLLGQPAIGFLPDAVADGHFNALSGKIMVRPRPDLRRHRAPTRLAALFHLGAPDDDTITEVSSARLNGLELARTLMSSAMDTRYAGSSRMEHQMRFVARVADLLPVHALRYPRTVAALDGVAREIRRIIGP